MHLLPETFLSCSEQNTKKQIWVVGASFFEIYSGKVMRKMIVIVQYILNIHDRLMVLTNLTRTSEME